MEIGRGRILGRDFLTKTRSTVVFADGEQIKINFKNRITKYEKDYFFSNKLRTLSIQIDSLTEIQIRN